VDTEVTVFAVGRIEYVGGFDNLMSEVTGRGEMGVSGLWLHL